MQVARIPRGVVHKDSRGELGGGSTAMARVHLLSWLQCIGSGAEDPIWQGQFWCGYPLRIAGLASMFGVHYG